MQEKRIALITGANRGLGLEATRLLAQHGIRVLMTCRDTAKGEAVARTLQSQGLDVLFHPLNVIDEDSIQSLSHFIEKNSWRLDILVNNAGIFPDDRVQWSAFRTSPDTLRQAFETNTLAPFRLCQTFLPMMQAQDYGRVVNMSSGMGQLSEMNGGCPGYRLSKTALNAVTRIFADELKGTNVLINAMCPGWVRTDMGGANADRSIEEGVKTVLWLATLPAGGPSGGFFRDQQLIPW